MTAVNNTIHTYTSCRRSSFGYPLLSLSETRTLSERLPVFSVNNFFSAMVYIFFCAWLWLFRARVPKQRLLRRGWDGSQNGFPKSPARRFRFWFLHTAFLGAERNGNGNNVHVGFSLLFYFCPQYSTWKALSGR